MTFTPGENVGQYRIIEALGQGGMATVFKAYHPSLDRYVAIKVLHPAFKEDQNFLARFNREARIVAKLDHPNIIPIFDFAQHGDTPYLVMRYVEGKTLKAVLREEPLPIAPAQVIAMLKPIASALTYAHAQGIFHRDIKPSNIMRAHDGHIYITDFGLARIAQAGESTMSQDMLIGTPQYISPEQARGVAIDERTDIYSFGVVLFEMLAGRVPFSADTPYAIIHDHIYTPLPLPTSINPNLSPEIERVLLKALAKDPPARFASVTELMNALEQASGTPAPIAIAMPPVETRTPSQVGSPPPERIAPQPTRRFTPLTCAVSGILAVILVLVCAWLALALGDDLATALRFAPPNQNAAIRDARARVTANPQDPTAHLQLADALANAKQYDAALGEFEQAIKLNPQMPDAYRRAGETAERAGNFDRALKYYDLGHKAIPNDIGLLPGLGDMQLRAKRHEDARGSFEQALRLDPGNAQAMWRMGEYYRALGKLAEALREYSRALAVDPNLPEAHYGLGMLAMQRGATDEARRQFQLVINNPKTPPQLKDDAQMQLRNLDKK
ncbi:MAG: tetratricopeptide repeat protein [Chloroflexi bacterium]|nr:tetratricopeptide repeat protein [Chloroflexota bacterium]